MTICVEVQYSAFFLKTAGALCLNKYVCVFGTACTLLSESEGFTCSGISRGAA